MKVFGIRQTGKFQGWGLVLALFLLVGCATRQSQRVAEGPPPIPQVAFREGVSTTRSIPVVQNWRVFNFTNEFATRVRIEFSTNLVDWFLIAELAGPRQIDLQVLPIRPSLFFRLLYED